MGKTGTLGSATATPAGQHSYYTLNSQQPTEPGDRTPAPPTGQSGLLHLRQVF